MAGFAGGGCTYDGLAMDGLGVGRPEFLPFVCSPPYNRSMIPKLTEYVEAGKQLTVDERLEAAHQLLLSVQQGDGEQLPDGAEWEAELLRRAKASLDGTAVLHDIDESHAQIRAELVAMRRK